MDSILTSVKKMLGIDESYEQFDPDIIMHINSVFMILHQLGVGPEDGFAIADKYALWDDYTSDDVFINSVKSYIYLKVRLLFDPPTSGTAMDNMKQLAAEMEWRLNVEADLGD